MAQVLFKLGRRAGSKSPKPAILVGDYVNREQGVAATQTIAFTYSESATIPNGTTTFTYLAANIGAATANRRVFVVMAGPMSVARIISSATIGGVASSVHLNFYGDNSFVGIFSLDVPTGTTTDIVVTMSDTIFNGVRFSIYTADKTTFKDVLTPSTGTSSIAAGLSLTNSFTGFSNGGALTATGWNNGTDKSPYTINNGFVTNDGVGIGRTATKSPVSSESQSVTTTWTGAFDAASGVASWEPAAVVAAGADVTVSLTGIALSTSQGTLSSTLSKTIDSQLAGLSQGAVSYVFNRTLDSQLISLSQGVLSYTLDKALGSQLLSLAQGAVTYVYNNPLTGQLLSLGQGTLTYSADANINVTLSGIALATSQAPLGYVFSKTAESQLLSLSQGNVSYAFSKTLVGNLISSSQGNLTLTNNLSLTGLALSSSQGSLTATNSLTLTGLAANTSQGALNADLSKTLTTQILQLSQGAVTAVIGADINVTLTGIGMGLGQGVLTATTTLQQDLGGLGKQLRKRALKQLEAPEGLSETDAEIRQLLIIASKKTALSLRGERKLLLPQLAMPVITKVKTKGKTKQIKPLTTVQIQALLALMIEMM